MLDPAISASKPVDVSEEMQKIAVDIMAQEGFDYPWDPNGPEARQTVLQGLQIASLEYFRYSQPTHFARFLAGPLCPEPRRANQVVTAMKKIIRNMLQAHREKKAAGPTSQSITSLMDENTNYRNDEERICDLMFIMVACYDTSS